MVRTMDTNRMCEAAGCGSEMTELVPDPYNRGESVTLLTAAPIIRVCDEHVRIIGDLYAAGGGAGPDPAEPEGSADRH